MIWLILIGLIPFAALGVLLGHVLTVDSVGPGSRWHHGALRPARRRLGTDRCRVASATPSCSCCRPTGWCRPGMSLTPVEMLAAEGLDRHRRLDHRAHGAGRPWRTGATPSGSDRITLDADMTTGRDHRRDARHARPLASSRRGGGGGGGASSSPVSGRSTLARPRPASIEHASGWVAVVGYLIIVAFAAGYLAALPCRLGLAAYAVLVALSPRLRACWSLELRSRTRTRSRAVTFIAVLTIAAPAQRAVA